VQQQSGQVFHLSDLKRYGTPDFLVERQVQYAQVLQELDIGGYLAVQIVAAEIQPDDVAVFVRHDAMPCIDHEEYSRCNRPLPRPLHPNRHQIVQLVMPVANR